MPVYKDLLSYEMAWWLRKRGKPMRPRLSKRQREDLKECFNAIDEDGTGINLDKLLEAFKVLDMKITRAEGKKLFERVDRDNSGAIEFPEFIEIMTATLSDMTSDNFTKKTGGTIRPTTSKGQSYAEMMGDYADAKGKLNQALGESRALPFPLIAIALRRKKVVDGLEDGDKNIIKQLNDKRDEIEKEEARAKMLHEYMALKEQGGRRAIKVRLNRDKRGAFFNELDKVLDVSNIADEKEDSEGEEADGVNESDDSPTHGEARKSSSFIMSMRQAKTAGTARRASVDLQTHRDRARNSSPSMLADGLTLGYRPQQHDKIYMAAVRSGAPRSNQDQGLGDKAAAESKPIEIVVRRPDAYRPLKEELARPHTSQGLMMPTFASAAALWTSASLPAEGRPRPTTAGGAGRASDPAGPSAAATRRPFSASLAWSAARAEAGGRQMAPSARQSGHAPRGSGLPPRGPSGSARGGQTMSVLAGVGQAARPQTTGAPYYHGAAPHPRPSSAMYGQGGPGRAVTAPARNLQAGLIGSRPYSAGLSIPDPAGSSRPVSRSESNRLRLRMENSCPVRREMDIRRQAAQAIAAPHQDPYWGSEALGPPMPPGDGEYYSDED